MSYAYPQFGGDLKVLIVPLRILAVARNRLL